MSMNIDWQWYINDAYQGEENGEIKARMADVWGQGKTDPDELTQLIQPKVELIVAQLRAFGNFTKAAFVGALNGKLKDAGNVQPSWLTFGLCCQVL